jgi:hypothetical protein
LKTLSSKTIRSIVKANLSDTDFEMPQLERAQAMSRS